MQSDWSTELPDLCSVVPVNTWFLIWQLYVRTRELRILAVTNILNSFGFQWLGFQQPQYLYLHVEICEEKQD